MDYAEAQEDLSRLLKEIEYLAQFATRRSGRFELARLQLRLDGLAKEILSWPPTDERDVCHEGLQDLQRMLNAVRENLI